MISAMFAVLGLYAVQLFLGPTLYWLRDRSANRIKDALSPRDEPLPLGRAEARAQRACANLQESLLLFLPLALLALHLDRADSSLALAGAWLFFAARAVYVPAYLLGWVPWRSVVWGLGLLGLGLMALGVALA